MRRGDDADLDCEMRDHVDRLIERNRAAGMNAADARRAALLQFGPRDALLESYRDTRGLRWLRELIGEEASLMA